MSEPPHANLVTSRVVATLAGDSASRVDIVGALRLSDGRFVIADALSGRLTYYHADGSVQSSIDVNAPTPGASRAFAHLFRVHGDTVAIASRSRAFVYDAQGQVIQRISTADITGDVPGRVRILVGVVAGGRSVIGVVGQQWPPPAGVTRWTDSMTFALVERDMSVGRVLGRYPNVMIGVKDSEPAQVWFAAHGVHTFVDSTLYYGFGDKYRIEVSTVTGGPTRVITRPWQPVRVTEQDIISYIDGWGKRWIRATGAEGEAQKLKMRSDPFFEYVPAFSQFLVSASGTLWVRSPNLVDARTNGELYTLPLVPSTWSIFARDGTWIGSVTLPARFFPRDVGADYVLGVEYGTGPSRKLVMFDVPAMPAAR